MQSVQLQTLHGRQVWWLYCGLWIIAGVIGAIVPLVGGNLARALTVFGLCAGAAAFTAVAAPRAQSKSGLYIDRNGLRGVGMFTDRTPPPGARANTALSTMEEHPGVWLTLPSANGKPKLVPGMLHVPTGSFLGFLFRSPNEVMVRDPTATDPAARQWRGTGAFWGDDSDAAIVPFLGQWLDEPAAAIQQTYSGNPGPAAYATSDAARPRIPGLPTVVLPFPLLIVLMWMLATSLASGLSILGFPAILLALVANHRVHEREIVIEPNGFRARGIFQTKLIPSRGPQLSVAPSRGGGAVIVAAMGTGKPKRLPALHAHRAMDSNNVLLVRYPKASDPNLRHWRATGVTWADGGQHVAWYLQQAVNAAQAQAFVQQPMYAQPGQFAHVPL